VNPLFLALGFTFQLLLADEKIWLGWYIYGVDTSPVFKIEPTQIK